MKLVYHCHGCGIDAECETTPDNPSPSPIGWVKCEHIDATFFWLCADCATRKGRYDHMKEYWKHVDCGADLHGAGVGD